MQAIRSEGAPVTALSAAETIRALAGAVAGTGANAVRDVLSTWAAREGLGATDAASLAAALRVSRVTAWRLLDRLDAACARAGIAMAQARSGFTDETRGLSPVKQAPRGERGGYGCVPMPAIPASIRSERSALRARVDEGGSAIDAATLEECLVSVMAKVKKRLGAEQRDALASHVAAKWDRIEACRGSRRAYAVAVALNHAREMGWLPRNGRDAARMLAQARPCEACGRLWTAADGCGCVRET